MDKDFGSYLMPHIFVKITSKKLENSSEELIIWMHMPDSIFSPIKQERPDVRFGVGYGLI